MNRICANSFISFFTLLVVLEVGIFVWSQYRYGLEARLCECKTLDGTKPRLVVNGTEIVSGDDLKWVAHLVTSYYYEPFNVINPSWILLASHCFLTSANDYRQLYRGSFYVAAGANHSIINTYRSSKNFKKVKRIILHEQFDPEEELMIGPAKHDIALVELEDPFELGEDVYPSCLLDWENSEFDDQFTLTGFGQAMPDHEQAFEYRDKERSTFIVARNRLKILYLKQKACPHDQAICMTNERDSVPYAGDSGAPLLYPWTSKLFVVGVMSKGEYRLSNLRLSSLYATPVQKHLAWIDAHIRHNRCISGGKLFRFDWTDFLLLMLGLLLTCFLSSYLLCTIEPTALETLRKPFERALVLLLDEVNLSTGSTGQ